MPTISLNANLSSEDLLKAVSQLDTPELDTFAARVLEIRAHRLAILLPDEEDRLIQEIKRGIPPDVQARFDTLIAKRHQRALGEDEYQELLNLTHRIEQHDAVRLEHIAALAQLRGKTLKEVMDQLGLKPK
jgi:hypothetical protein